MFPIKSEPGNSRIISSEKVEAVRQIWQDSNLNEMRLRAFGPKIEHGVILTVRSALREIIEALGFEKSIFTVGGKYPPREVDDCIIHGETIEAVRAVYRRTMYNNMISKSKKTKAVEYKENNAALMAVIDVIETVGLYGEILGG